MIRINNFNLPRIIGHRGVKNLFPENTIESILAAFNLGLDCVEIDVKISKDKVPILMHDHTLDRTTSGSGFAHLHRFEDIKKLDAGSFFYKKKTNCLVPTLEEVLKLFVNTNKILNIELKPSNSLEKDNVKEIFKLTSKYDSVPIYYSSFDLKSCLELISINKNAFCGLILDSFKDCGLSQLIALSKKNNFYACGLNKKIITVDVVRELIEKKIIVTVYSDKNITNNEAKELWNMGVQSIFSDDPTSLLNNF